MKTTRVTVPSLLSLILLANSIMGADAKLAFHLAEAKPTEGWKEVTESGTGRKIFVEPKAVLTGHDVATAATVVLGGFPAISVTFTKTGGVKMAKLTQENKGKMLAIFVNGKLISAPVIRSKMADQAVITGHFTRAEAEKIAKEISGK
jgi:preprotein translocase subunit SecD